MILADRPGLAFLGGAVLLAALLAHATQGGCLARSAYSGALLPALAALPRTHLLLQGMVPRRVAVGWLMVRQCGLCPLQRPLQGLRCCLLCADGRRRRPSGVSLAVGEGAQGPPL